MTKTRTRQCVAAALIAMAAPLVAPAAWQAHNDLAWASGQTNYRITRLSFIDDANHDTNGQLNCHADGQTSGVYAAFSVTAAGSFSTNMAPPAPGSPADLVFSGKVDMGLPISAPASAVGTIAFTGMDPAGKYRVVLFGNRNMPPTDSNYTNRTTKITLGGADSFFNASSSGAVISGISNETAEIVVGTNNTGQIFDYADVAPGGDGQVALTVTGGAGNPYSWYLNTMMVELQSNAPALPSVANGTATLNGPTSATLAGTLASTGASPTQVWLYWKAGSDGGTNATGWTFNAALGYEAAGALSIAVSNLTTNTTYYYRYCASNAIGAAWANPAASFLTESVPAMPATVLFTNGAAWKYHNTGALPASDWTARTYNDASWASGAAPLGYAETTPATATTLSYGTNSATKWPTYYFRKHFTITNAAAVPGLVASLLFDDAAVVYLNGAKVYVTTNMCEPFDNDSWAIYDVGEPLAWRTFTISPTDLVSGDNVIAVEVHQVLKNSSDVSFDMTLSTTSYAATNQPGGQVTTWQVLPAETWVAYNDLAWSSGQSEIRVTRYSFVDDSLHDLAGPLVRLDGGKTCEVSVTFSPGSMAPVIHTVTNSGAPAGWTPADLLFSGKADMDQWLYFTVGPTGTITFSGMHPVRRYKVVLFGNRGATNYTARQTVLTLTGADAFTNISSPGAVISGAAGRTTTIVTGINTAGLVFAYSGIAAGTDGEVQLEVSGLGAVSDSAYLNTLRVELLPTGGEFVDRDADGMDDEWEFDHFGAAGWNAAGSGAGEDWDGDGMSNDRESLAGTDPSSADSLFAVAALSNSSPTGVVIRWASEAGRLYSVLQTTNLLSAWNTQTSKLASTPPMNVYTSPTATNAGFWKVRGDGSSVVSIAVPMSRMVFQRNNANQAVIPIKGQCPRAADRMDARAVARQIGWGTTTGWTTLSPAPANGAFSGKITVQGGWYDLELKAFQGGTEIAGTALERIGVGEVFVGVGHSVVQGDTEHEANLYATDDRVNTVPKLPEHFTALNMYGKEADPRYLPLTFAQCGDYVMPMLQGSGPYLWVPFAQYIAQTQNVPVLIFNSGAGGSTLFWWARSAQGLPYTGMYNAWDRMPYGMLYNIMKEYIALTGVRALLCDHGQNDASDTEEVVFQNYKTWVEQARRDLGYAQLAVVINRATPSSGATQIRNAQLRMIQEPYCFAGPDYDTLPAEARYDGIHLSQTGQALTAVMWANSLSNQFFSASTPWLPGY